MVPAVTETAIAPLYLLSVAQYHAMIREGILTSDDRVELIEGMLVRKMSKNEAHMFVVDELVIWLRSLALTNLMVRAEGAITLPASEPEPDVYIARGSRRMYLELDRHPQEDEVLLVAEVSDATLGRDRSAKYRMYASARIPQYWIVDVANRQIAIYREPVVDDDGARYTRRDLFDSGETVVLELDGREMGRLNVSVLFG